MLASELIFGAYALRIAAVVAGIVSVAMGYRLFVLGITAPAGDAQGSVGKYKFSGKDWAPGTFFALFGAAIIVAAVFFHPKITTGPTKSIQQEEPPLPRTSPPPESKT